MTAESEKTALSFGRYLQSIRVEKGISLKAVSQETRIRLETLHYIEAEDHQHLPDEVYVKGFLRAYAKAIGADGDEAVQHYISRLAVKRKIALSEAALYRTGGAFWRRLLLSIAAVICLIAATLYAVSAWREHHMPKEAVSTEMAEPPTTEPAIEKPDALSTTPAEEKAVPAPATEASTEPSMDSADDKEVSTSEASTGSAPPPVIAEKYRLSIDTIEETWLKIIVDDQQSKQYRLNPGDHIELEGSRNFNLLIGNAGGIRLELNGKAVALSGKSGQVVNLQLP
ncbi:MAG: RodZ domain-containing protein [Desulfobacterales bacterium]|jgi:cytoskeletal protein RodZ